MLTGIIIGLASGTVIGLLIAFFASPSILFREDVYEKEDGSVWISRMNSGFVAKPMSSIIRTTMSDAAKDMEEVIARVLAD